jgi:hypothetical protein
MDWYRSLRIILRQEKTEYVLLELYPKSLPAGSSAADHIAYEKRYDDVLNISCLMLTIMSPDLQKQYEHIDAYTMIQGLRRMFENQASAERYNISKALFTCKLAEGSPISPHVIKMMCYIETLDKLGCELKDDLATDVILQSLLVSYELATNMEKTVAELHGVLKIAEDNIKKNPNYVMMVQKEKKKRKCWTPPKDNGKKKVSDEPSSSKSKTKGKPCQCFHCNKKGHWFKNCKMYLEEQKKKGSETFTLCINVIKINITVFSSDSGVFDIESMIHTCKLL